MGRVKGTITVFLSLISVLFLSLICTAVESARIQGARAQAANVVDMGNYSVFGEFEQRLLEDYEIFAVNGAYGTGDFSIERVNGRLRTFMEKNSPAQSGGLAGLCFDPWQLGLEESEISEYALLTDQGGEAFYQQAVSFMKETAVTGTIGKLFQYHHDAQSAQSNQEDYQRGKNNSDAQMEDLEQQEAARIKELEEQAAAGENAGGDLVIVGEAPGEVVQENPLTVLEKLKRKSILDVVCSKYGVSERTVSKSEVASKRKLQTGNMELSGEHGGLTSDLLFREYLLDHFENYQDRNESGKLNYQIEYVIGGKRSDRENLKSVVRKLLLLREGCNYVYCIRNSDMSAQAGALAALLIGWLGIPPLVTVMKHALLLAWAYGESMLDVKTLMDGGHVPLVKTGATWRLTLDQLANLETLLSEDGGNRQEGADYQDHLRILLNLQSVSTQKKRALDLVEMNLSVLPGLSNFQADDCVVGIRTQVTWRIRPVFLRVSAAFLGVSAPGQTVTVNSGFAYE